MTDKEIIIKNLNSGVKCNPDCPLHKLVTHNTCICCKAFKDSPYHKDYLKGKTDDEIAAHYQKVIKNITNYDDSYDASISIKALHNISDIINKAKGEGICQ